LIFIIFLVVQRLTELIIAKKNEVNLISKGGKEFDIKGYNIIVLIHSFFIVSLITEFIMLKKNISEFWFIILPLYLILQILRYWIIFSLGKYWNTKLIFLPSHNIVRKGPYKFLKHPNYFVVKLEFLLIPLLFNSFITLIIFSIINFLILLRRIKIENKLIDQFGI
jgi:methyltransferase